VSDACLLFNPNFNPGIWDQLNVNLSPSRSVLLIPIKAAIEPSATALVSAIADAIGAYSFFPF
jgi:hypothetical protein